MINVLQTLLETTALCIHPALVTNANDAAQVAAFPPAVSRRGGRRSIRPSGGGHASPLEDVRIDCGALPYIIQVRAAQYAIGPPATVSGAASIRRP